MVASDDQVPLLGTGHRESLGLRFTSYHLRRVPDAYETCREKCVGRDARVGDRIDNTLGPPASRRRVGGREGCESRDAPVGDKVDDALGPPASRRRMGGREGCVSRGAPVGDKIGDALGPPASRRPCLHQGPSGFDRSKLPRSSRNPIPQPLFIHSLAPDPRPPAHANIIVTSFVGDGVPREHLGVTGEDDGYVKRCEKCY